MLHVGIVSPTRPQGLSTMAMQLGRLVDSIEGAWSIFSHAHDGALGEEVDRHIVQGVEFEAWVREVDVVVFLEAVKPEWLDATDKAKVQTVLVPMWEWLDGERPVSYTHLTLPTN